MEEDEVFRIYSMLHLIFHRNRNQHGRTKWWKWLSILKRAVWNLAMSLSSSKQGDFRTSAENYKQYLADRVLPRCYLAFSVVIADVQFSALGAVLFAILAQLSKSTGIAEEFKLPSPVETNHNSLASYTEVPTRIDDIGEALPRPAEPSEVAEDFQLQQPVKPVLAVSNKSSASQTLNVTEPEKKMKKKKKQKEKGSETKKRRKENAIDDLFDGLF
ncbi:hypothetical protein AN6495.2 [Aspergillus nidulans FGSC A4]|uniref:RNase MRP protein 1 RNA binding domain-containing protein n=1 Tax=Emericella nidulans (strain FGSC A4 / ATCC 38163 / CBS 112.46 / NRRL 194 / M139) TaxID=227321 RepID=Q5AYY5_EMENI|nr:hypothetical protein [Aspergillus nidulans FGSC A4]EAA57835.1 hypothetical protein AN6495.2 [Aspergillus nidulans FGSC A4]CBF70848.1 TPA: conserved hypothetical protein [Aspergillus nidulans FGSC A4]|eukprot:XP_664099.1 hypothetical protein AN6495.2 [Aspergillus nidulans FGSC A4]